MRMRTGALGLALLAASAVAAIPAPVVAAQTPATAANFSPTVLPQWVRGHAVTIINHTGKPIELNTATNTQRFNDLHGHYILGPGETRHVNVEWRSSDATNVLGKVTFRDGLGGYFEVQNPPIGTPSVRVQDFSRGVHFWQDGLYSHAALSEHERWSTKAGGHEITFVRQGDDSHGHHRAKVWKIDIH